LQQRGNPTPAKGKEQNVKDMQRFEPDISRVEITYLPTDGVVIPERQRRKVDPDHIKELAISIKQRGLLHPIVVSGDQLIAGYCRLQACRSLGWPSVPVNDIKVLDPIDQQWIELEENIKRRNLSYQEECDAVRKIYELGQAKFGRRLQGDKSGDGFGVEDVAEILGKSIGFVSDAIKVSKGLEVDPTLSGNKKRTVLAKLKKKEETAWREVLTELDEELELAPERREVPWTFKCTAAQDFLKELPDASIHCAIIDPPWNVGLEERWDDAAWDKEENCIELLTSILPELQRSLTPGGYLYLFFAIWSYGEICSLVRRWFTIDEIPLIWAKGTTTMTSYTYQRYAPAYEPILFCQKDGDSNRTLTQMLPNVFAVPPVGGNLKIHPAQKPLALLQRIIENSTIPGETVLDCFAGSGASLAAAVSLNRKAIGCEKDPLLFEKASIFIDEAWRQSNGNSTEESAKAS
jgi:ParB/RepB/Spo0J family partition protein